MLDAAEEINHETVHKVAENYIHIMAFKMHSLFPSHFNIARIKNSQNALTFFNLSKFEGAAAFL